MFPRIVEDKCITWIADFWQKATFSPLPSFGFIEIPFDFAVSHRPGTRFGPKKIIKKLNECTLYCADKRVSLENTIMTHFGVVDVVQSMDQSYINIANVISSLPGNYIPVCLGGDHSITAPIFSSIKNKYRNENIGLLVFDSHFDSREIIPGRYHSGNWIKTLETVIDYNNFVQCGISANIYSKEYMDFAEKRGAMIITVYDVRKAGLFNIIKKIFKKLKISKLYVSIDIDVIDQAFAPGTSVPNSNGFFSHEVIDAIFEIAKNYDIVGCDITEVSPPLDINGMTSGVAANIIMNLMAGVVSRK